MTEKLIIRTDITDWQDEAMREELLPDDEDAIFKALDEKKSSAQVARAVVVAREKRLAPEDIIRPNKMLIQAGGQMDILQMAHRRKHQVTAKNGTKYNVPAYVGAVAEKNDGDEDEEDNRPVDNSFVSAENPEARERAEDYLERIVPGYVWGRLLIIYDHGGDVRNEADKLKETIDDMVNRIMQPVRA